MPRFEICTANGAAQVAIHRMQELEVKPSIGEIYFFGQYYSPQSVRVKDVIHGYENPVRVRIILEEIPASLVRSLLAGKSLWKEV